MSTKRLFTAALAALLCAVSLPACSPASPDPAGTTDPAASTSSGPLSDSTDTEPVETSVKDIPDGLPEDKKFDGAPYTIMIPNPSFRAKYRYDLTEDEITDSLDQACYGRTKAIEDRFDVKFTTIEGTGNGKEFTKLSDFAAAGEYAVDLVIPNGNGYGKAGTAIINGLVLDWDTLPYVDLTKPWWSSELIDSLRVSGKAYAAFGDINVTRAFYGAMIFNKSLFDDVQEAYPYEMVQSGKWTYDELLRLNAKATKDLDGNGTFDENDRYGLLANESFLGNFQMYWGASEVVKLDKNGQMSLDVPAERIQTIADRVLSMLDTGNVYYFANSEVDKPFAMFASSQGMFYMFDFASQHAKLRNIDAFDYGVLPMPKLDESQKDYCSGVTSSMFMFSMLKDAERTGIITEALASSTRKEVYDVFVDSMLYGKIAQDRRDVDMINIIYAHPLMEAVRLFSPKQDLMNLVKSCVTSRTNTVQSKIAELKPAVQAVLDDFNTRVTQTN